MRSHTGDRPYKCQHCGDQFSRSDLLNRHIKKCHPDADDPTANKDGGKRKTNTINRATTSKQACDQCVQSSLPCNGANPCSKCAQRKVRCTFVMFHRQTAPVGPGHPSATPFTSNPYVDLPTSIGGVAYAAPQQPQQPYHTQHLNGSMARYGRSASLNLGHVRPPFDIPASMPEQGRNFGMAPEPHQDLSHSHIPFDFEFDYENHQDSRFAHAVTNHYPESSHTSPPSGHLQYQYPNQQQQQQRPTYDEQPRPSSSHFSSAFGLMSLEDPKTEQQTPFFSHTQSATVPVQVPHRPSPDSTASSYSSSSSGFQHGSTPSSYSSVGNLSAASWKDFDSMPPRETETRELKEFWRQYQSHSPPPGSFEGPTSSLATPSATRRHRVNSLPSVKTPTADLYSSRNNQDNYGWYPEGATSRAAAGVGMMNPPARPMHGEPSEPHGDDLKSYEAAVLARHVNTDLIMPRSKGMPEERPNFKRLPSRVLGPEMVKKVRG